MSRGPSTPRHGGGGGAPLPHLTSPLPPHSTAPLPAPADAASARPPHPTTPTVNGARTGSLFGATTLVDAVSARSADEADDDFATCPTTLLGASSATLLADDRCASAEPEPPAKPGAGIAAEADALLLGGALSLQKVPSDCTGGAYFLSGPEGVFAVLKPADEEPGMPFNPKGLVNGEPGRQGFRPGGGAARELLVHELDRGLAGVPETVLWNAPHSLLGRCGGEGAVLCSLQRYAPAQGEVWDYTPSRFAAAAVRRVALLDLLTLNCDRHGGNLLAVAPNGADAGSPRSVGSASSVGGGGEWGLVPIDHGYCVPNSLTDLDFEWQHWAQARTPLSDDERRWVAGVDPAAAAALAARHGTEPGACALLRCAAVCLKAGVSRGLTVAQMAGYWRRESAEERSGLERLADKWLGTEGGATDWGGLRTQASADMRELRGGSNASRGVG